MHSRAYQASHADYTAKRINLDTSPMLKVWLPRLAIFRPVQWRHRLTNFYFKRAHQVIIFGRVAVHHDEVDLVLKLLLDFTHRGSHDFAILAPWEALTRQWHKHMMVGVLEMGRGERKERWRVLFEEIWNEISIPSPLHQESNCAGSPRQRIA